VAAVVARREIIAEPEVVWATVSDVDRWPRILTSLASLQRLEGTGLEVGVRWRESRPILGLTATYEVTVTDVQRVVGFTLSAAFDDATVTTEYRLRPSSLGTRLEATVEADAGGVALSKRLRGVIAIGGPRIAREVADRDLADFQAALRP
jgi:carbon monoxide dehydrogenase subunit G